LIRHTALMLRLRELIAALDRRRPRAGHATEASVARASDALRQEAVERLAGLEADSRRRWPGDEQTGDPSIRLRPTD
jgi:hypothetical protein